MEKPSKEKYGYVESTGFDSEPSGFVIEGGEEAYEEALRKWEEYYNGESYQDDPDSWSGGFADNN